MGEIKALDMGQSQIIYVEVDDTDVQLDTSAIKHHSDESISDLPDGAEPTSFGEKIVDAADIVQNNIKTVSQMVHQSLETIQPDEWEVELTIGFKGSAGIPVLVNGEASGAIKVKAKWKRQ